MAVPAAAAPGQSCTATPDNPSINQYCESVPTTQGNRGVADTQKRPGAAPAAPERTVSDLSASRDGRIIVSALPRAKRPEKKRIAKRSPVPTERKRVTKRSTASAGVIAADTGGLSSSSVADGLPPIFYVLIGGVILALVARVFGARRRRDAA